MNNWVAVIGMIFTSFIVVLILPKIIDIPYPNPMKNNEWYRNNLYAYAENIDKMI